MGHVSVPWCAGVCCLCLTTRDIPVTYMSPMLHTFPWSFRGLLETKLKAQVVPQYYLSFMDTI